MGRVTDYLNKTEDFWKSSEPKKYLKDFSDSLLTVDRELETVVENLERLASRIDDESFNDKAEEILKMKNRLKSLRSYLIGALS